MTCDDVATNKPLQQTRTAEKVLISRKRRTQSITTRDETIGTVQYVKPTRKTAHAQVPVGQGTTLSNIHKVQCTHPDLNLVPFFEFLLPFHHLPSFIHTYIHTYSPPAPIPNNADQSKNQNQNAPSIHPKHPPHIHLLQHSHHPLIRCPTSTPTPALTTIPA